MLDLLLNVLALALVPFTLAAMGGHLAADVVHDPKKKRLWVLAFYAIALVGVAIVAAQVHRADRSASVNKQQIVDQTTTSVTAAVKSEDAYIIDQQKLQIANLQKRVDGHATDALSDAKQKFETTSKRLDGMIAKTAKVAITQNFSLRQIVGGMCPEIILRPRPRSEGGYENNGISLLGKREPVYDLGITIWNSSPNSASSEPFGSVHIAALLPDLGTPMINVPLPVAQDGTASIQFDIFSRGGVCREFWTEEMLEAGLYRLTVELTTSNPVDRWGFVQMQCSEEYKLRNTRAKCGTVKRTKGKFEGEIPDALLLPKPK